MERVPQKMCEDSDGVCEKELKSIEGKGLPLSLGRKQDCDKEEQRGKQHNGRTGRDIPVRGDEDSSD